MSDEVFKPFPKIARFHRDIVITEKLDGTNAQVLIDPLGAQTMDEYEDKVGGVPLVYTMLDDGTLHAIWAGSRSKMLGLGKANDNFGFARWVFDNHHVLAKLGPGRHFGEWWGKGIQRGYGLEERRFSLFNTSRWTQDTTPKGIHVVPVLYEGPMSDWVVKDQVSRLRVHGSVAAPGFMDPEGVVVWHSASGQLYKVTCWDDEVPKSRLVLNPK